MTRLPAKRTRAKMGAREPEQKVWPRHRRWVKSHGCCVPSCSIDGLLGVRVPIDFAHVKSVGAGGQDWHGISLCRLHHDEQHRAGIETFAAKYGIDLWALAAAFVKASPDSAMREAMRALETT